MTNKAPLPARGFVIGWKEDDLCALIPLVEGEVADDQNLDAAKRFLSLSDAVDESTKQSCSVFAVITESDGHETLKELLVDLKKVEEMPFPGCFRLMDNLVFGPTPVCTTSTETQIRFERLSGFGIRSIVTLASRRDLVETFAGGYADQFDRFRNAIFPFRREEVPTRELMKLILNKIEESVDHGEGAFVCSDGGGGRTCTTAACFVARHAAGLGDAALNLVARRRFEVGLFDRSPTSAMQRQFANNWSAGL